MKTVLITGATGNVGLEVIKALQQVNHSLDIVAGVRNIEKDTKKLAAYSVSLKTFDFENIDTYKTALEHVDILFLLRPPQIANVDKYFKPLINTAKKQRVQHIIFLSVQGVENSKFIPHHKIEKLIVERDILYTFLRPAYFMQNFTTTLYNDLKNKSKIFLPAGDAKFTVIDVRDIGAVAAQILLHINNHSNKAYDLTNNEKLTFEEMADKLSAITGRKIMYQSPNLLRFFIEKKKERLPAMFILVMIMLHYLPRFQKEPSLSNWVQQITGKEPISFDEFVNDYKPSLS